VSATRWTLAAPARLAQEVRKSRFVANAAAITDADEAAAFIARVSARDATHNCWAWRVGQHYRFNDDGEPAGTAGRPILQAIDGQGLDRLAVVVTRWFGGIKLGAGGLMRAYGGCAAECLRGAARRELVAMAEVEFRLAFASLPLLHARLSEFDAHTGSEHFDGDGATLHVVLPDARVAALRSFLADLSRGQCQLRVLD
jgi:uncharacterized YigZ family protein